jgi:DNA-binding NtrC family response regulator
VVAPSGAHRAVLLLDGWTGVNIDPSRAAAERFAMSPELLPGVRVLLVEDESLIRWALTQTLVAAGARVVEAADARSAIDALRAGAQGFDVAVLDVRLPDGSGLGLLATIRQSWPKTSVLLMTAFDPPELWREACALGALGVVEKPFELDAMTRLILGAARAA